MPQDSEQDAEDDEFAMTTVSAQVSKSKKVRWEQAVDEGEEYSSLSDLIRVAVSRELGDSYVHQSEATVDANISVDTDELVGEFDKRFEEVFDRIDRLAAIGPQRSEKDASLSNRILDLVPSLPGENEARDWIDMQTDEQGDLKSEFVESDDEGRSIAASPRLATYLDEEEYAVRETMYRIEKGSSRYVTIRDHGITWLFEFTGYN